MLAQILERNSHLRARNAEDGDRFEAGTIYVAPPDHHLVVKKDGTLRVARGPRENRHRPAVDPLFRSAAVAYGANVIAVVLTGALDDGTAGAAAVKKRGGTVVVQDPRDAMYPSMPESAIEHVKVDHVVTLANLVPLLTQLAWQPPAPLRPVAAPPDTPVDKMDQEARMAELDHDALHDDNRPGQPSPYSCPDCGGVLWEIKEDDFMRYRCRVGHAFSPEAMLSAQDEVLEEALWTAMKTLEESARLSKRLSITEQQRGHDWLAKRFEEKESDARHRVEVIRRYLLRGDTAAQG
jgi:two-component system chemotaxis response regulator CheB